MIKTMAVIENETKLLDTLSTMEVGSRIISTTVKDETGTALVDRRLKELHLEELVPLTHKSAEYLALEEYLVNTAGHTHCVFHVITPLNEVCSNKAQTSSTTSKTSSASHVVASKTASISTGKQTPSIATVVCSGTVQEQATLPES